MAKTINNKVENILVRMYRVGTGDFFLLQMRNRANKVIFKLMIDCGCIDAKKDDFVQSIENLIEDTQSSIDLLVVTHEHADHINGFEKSKDLMNQIDFKEVWFAWTEKDDPIANEFRKEHTKMKLAIQAFANKFKTLHNNGEFKSLYDDDYFGTALNEANGYFISQLDAISSLNLNDKRVNIDEVFNDNPMALNNIPTMEDKLKEWLVIKEKSTKVKFLNPGTVIEKLNTIEGLRVFVLGPPKDNDAIKVKEVKKEGYEKREKPSTQNFASLAKPSSGNLTYTDVPFDEMYVMSKNEYGTMQMAISKKLSENENDVRFPDLQAYISALYIHTERWRSIDYDWMYSIGSLALRHETSINNTSLSLAFQFTESDKVLLFPGDGEHGHWLSWFNYRWKYKDSNGKQINIGIEDILGNTAFYKVGHHLSQNGTLKGKGLELMPDDSLVAMATLDMESCRAGWRNTMPNDLLGAELIRKTNGNLYFLGDWGPILKNIKTDRVSVSKTEEKALVDLNKKVKGDLYIEVEISK